MIHEVIYLGSNDAINKSIAYMFQDCVWLCASESILESSSLKESLNVVWSWFSNYGMRTI